MNVTLRLIEFAKYLKLSVSGFEATVNQPGRLQAAKQKDRNPNSDLLEIISEKYSDLNMNWVLTGKGEMLVSASTGQKDTSAELQKQLLQVQHDLINCMKQNAELKESSAGIRRTPAPQLNK